MEKIILFIALLSGCVGIGGALKCLQCLDRNPGQECVSDYMGLVNASLGLETDRGQPYTKVCNDGAYTGIQQKFCVIEKYYVGGVLKSFIRDCSDGEHFSYTDKGNKTTVIAKLASLVPDNFTTCAYQMSANAHVCVSLCRGEDFCNAPRPPPKEICDNSTGNATCGAASLLLATPGPFGPIVDRVLGRAYFLPVLITLLSVHMFGVKMI